MLFNSIEFLFLFLPLVLAGFLALQHLGSQRLLLVWLIGASLVFYGWWNPVYLLLLIGSALTNYTIGYLISSSEDKTRNSLLAFGVLFNLSLLGYFKYANFFVDTMRVALDWSFHFEYVILPLAISFYTFQQITYLVDTKRGKTGPHSFLEYALFVSFFPQLIAGPIVHHSEMLAQFGGLTERANRVRNLTIGFSILFIGLFKKVVIADGFAQFATPVFDIAAAGGTLYTMDAVAGMFSYAFQLYFDFSGYSDMAIGLACLFGIKLPVNFFSPYRAQNISDFWRMWHATLSRFLRDYVYAGLGGFMCSPWRQRFNLFTTMFIGGVWHGAGWTFIVYGIFHGAYVVIHQLWRIKVSGPLRLVPRKDYRFIAQVVTFLAVCLSLVVFRADTLSAAGHIYMAMADWSGANFVPAYGERLAQSNLVTIAATLLGADYSLTLVYLCLALALAACWLLPSTYQLFRECDVCIDKPLAGRAAVMDFQWSASQRWAVFIGLLAVCSFLNLTQVSEFLYFQF